MSRVGYRPGQPISNERLLIGGLSALAVATGSLMGAGAANADVYYKNCSEARAAGLTPIYHGQAGLPAWS
jgi:hypothetical protein